MQGLSGFHSFTSEVQRLGGIAASVLIGFSTDASLPDAFRKHFKLAETEAFIAVRRVSSIDVRIPTHPATHSDHIRPPVPTHSATCDVVS